VRARIAADISTACRVSANGAFYDPSGFDRSNELLSGATFVGGTFERDIRADAEGRKIDVATRQRRRRIRERADAIAAAEMAIEDGRDGDDVDGWRTEEDDAATAAVSVSVSAVVAERRQTARRKRFQQEAKQRVEREAAAAKQSALRNGDGQNGADTFDFNDDHDMHMVATAAASSGNGNSAVSTLLRVTPSATDAAPLPSEMMAAVAAAASARVSTSETTDTERYWQSGGACTTHAFPIREARVQHTTSGAGFRTSSTPSVFGRATIGGNILDIDRDDRFDHATSTSGHSTTRRVINRTLDTPSVGDAIIAAVTAVFLVSSHHSFPPGKQRPQSAHSATAAPGRGAAAMSGKLTASFARHDDDEKTSEEQSALRIAMKPPRQQLFNFDARNAAAMAVIDRCHPDGHFERDFVPNRILRRVRLGY
jgi:hypothetical protein